MFIDFLTAVFDEHRDREALVWRDRSFSYDHLLTELAAQGRRLDDAGILPGSVVVLEGDFTPATIALFLALIERAAIIVPLTAAVGARRDELLDLARGEFMVTVGEDDTVSIAAIPPANSPHDLTLELRRRGHPGLVLFSSGSTGASKGIVHDLDRLLGKFRTRRHDLRTLVFLLFDHIGGIDTLLYSLSNGSGLVTIDDRSPDAVCRTIARHRVEVLPVSPTFLNLLLLSGAWREHDLSSLRYITYGAEVMPEGTLKKCAEIFPNVTLLQKYGTTEVGTLRSKSRGSDSLWVKVGGEGYRTRVVDGLLEIKADSAMLGYLNAPSPFTADGWFMTGDAVEVDGEWMRILGRQSELINVGGEKVYPTEVENVILAMENVSDATVYAESNPMVGQIVCARVTLMTEEPERAFVTRLKQFCRERLESFKVPVKVTVTTAPQHSDRFKKKRLTLGHGG